MRTDMIPDQFLSHMDANLFLFSLHFRKFTLTLHPI